MDEYAYESVWHVIELTVDDVTAQTDPAIVTLILEESVLFK